MARAAHSIQLIDRKLLNKSRWRPPLRIPPSDDSSEASIDDYDDIDTDDNAPPRRKKRTSMSEQQRNNKVSQWKGQRAARRRQIRQQRRRGLKPRGPHYILLEYMANGDLANLVYRVNEQFDNDIPNRVLWSFFLCCESPEVATKSVRATSGF